MVFRKLKERRQRKKEERKPDSKQEVEVIDFENNKTYSLDEYKNKKSEDVFYGDEYSVINNFMQRFKDEDEAIITRTEFYKLLEEIKKTQRKNVENIYDKIIAELIYAFSNKGVKTDGESDSRRTIQEHDKKRHTEEKKDVEKSG